MSPPPSRICYHWYRGSLSPVRRQLERQGLSKLLTRSPAAAGRDDVVVDAFGPALAAVPWELGHRTGGKFSRVLRGVPLPDTVRYMRRAIDALGSHIVRVAIDVDPAGGLNGTVVVARGLFGSRELPVETGEAIRLALDEGAPIETSRDLLEVAGVSEEEARTLALDSARGRAPEADSMPVHTF